MFQRHKMVVLVRDDLKMGRGKVAAQCCHGAPRMPPTWGIARHRTRPSLWVPPPAVLALYRRVSRDQPGRLRAWEGFGEAKIVLRVPDLAALCVATPNYTLVYMCAHTCIRAQTYTPVCCAN